MSTFLLLILRKSTKKYEHPMYRIKSRQKIMHGLLKLIKHVKTLLLLPKLIFIIRKNIIQRYETVRGLTKFTFR